MKKWIILLSIILVLFIGYACAKSYSPIDVLEIQEQTLEMKTGEIIQLTVKGYKYKSDGEKLEEVDISDLQISWKFDAENGAFVVSEDGKIEALKRGIGNVYASYKDKVGSRAITVFVSTDD